MATLDLTLAALRLAGLTNFTPEFGTKEADGVSVSTENVCKDIMLPFTFQRPVLVSETSDTGNIEANRTLVLTNSGIVLTLGRATFAGCKVTVQTGFTSGGAQVRYLTAANTYETVTLAAGNSVEIVSNSDLYFYTMGLDVYGVDTYNPATTYSTLGESVLYAGIQFVNINASANLGKTPLIEPLYWLPCPDSRDLFVKSVHGLPVWGASHPIHDFNNAAYKQSFGLGTHRIGGYNGTTFTAVGIHLDGQAIGGSGTALSGIVEAWHLKDIWMPGSEGSRLSIDARGRLLRAIDATGGQADSMAEVLEDRMQGHKHSSPTLQNKPPMWGIPIMMEQGIMQT